MALINATNDAVKKVRTDIYNGGAEIVSVEPVEPRFTNGLTDEEKANAFDIEFVVKPDDANVPVQTISCPFSVRKPSWDKRGRTETELSSEDLTRQGLMVNDDPATVFSCVGKKCQISVYDETKGDRTYHVCRFSAARPKISQVDVLKRMAALRGAAPAPKANPFA